MHRGFWQFWRKWQDHELSKDSNANLIFCHICCHAAIEPRVNRRYGYTIGVGESDLTVKQLSERSSLTIGEVKNALDRLVAYGTIERLPTKGRVPSITKLVNWPTYKNLVQNVTTKIDTKEPVSSRLAAGKQPLLDTTDTIDTEESKSHSVVKTRRKAWADDWHAPFQAMIVNTPDVATSCKIINLLAGTYTQLAVASVLADMGAAGKKFQTHSDAVAYIKATLSSRMAKGTSNGNYQQAKGSTRAAISTNAEQEAQWANEK